MVGKHLSAMAEVVAGHGGMIDKFQGDAVMAIFGAPEPQPDHAGLALRCAIAMQERQDELNEEGWGVEDLPVLGVGIGVNTGRVIAGTVGGGGRLEYTVVGDAVKSPRACNRRRRGARSWRPPVPSPPRLTSPVSRSALVTSRVARKRSRCSVSTSIVTEERSSPRPSRWPWLLVAMFCLFAIGGTVLVFANDEASSDR